jgi:hypothetical protein
VAQVLKGLQFSNNDSVAQMNIRCRRIEAQLDAKRLTRFRRPLKLGFQVLFPDQVDRAFF